MKKDFDTLFQDHQNGDAGKVSENNDLNALIKTPVQRRQRVQDSMRRNEKLEIILKLKMVL